MFVLLQQISATTILQYLNIINNQADWQNKIRAGLIPPMGQLTRDGMKKIFTLLFAGLLSLTAVQARLILHESFDGVNGEVGQLCAGATNTEDFFNGMFYEQTRWWSYSGSSNYIQVAEGSLSYSGYQTAEVGNKAYLWSTGADDLRSFSAYPVTSGKVYLGAIINVEEVKQKTDADYFLHLGDHANNYFVAKLYAKSVMEGDQYVGYKLAVAKSNESANYLRYTDETYAPDANILVIMEYEFVEGDQNDIVRLYVNPNKNTVEPTVTIVPDTITGGGVQQGANSKADVGISGIFGVFLRQGTNTPKMFVDEIKVATSWNDLWSDEIEETGLEQISNIERANKIIREGQLIICRDGKKFNALGIEVR